MKISGKRIALLGNMNNNFFNLTRYLHDLHYKADLFIFPFDPIHFHPEADSFDNSHGGYVKKLKWGNPFDLRLTTIDDILKDVGDYDFYIACGSAPAYLAKAGLKVDLFIPYGYDLYNWPFFKLVRPLNLWNYFIFTRLQKKGIRNARNISIADNSVVFQRALDKIGFSGNRLYSGIPMVYTGQYSPEKITNLFKASAYYQAFLKIRNQFDLIIFHNSRHCWKNESDPVSLKDNDKLFKGLSKYIASTKNRSVAIITFEYGSDVMATKELIRSLRLESNVFWFPLLPRKEIMLGMMLADIVAGEFRNSWFTYGVVFESMALGKPIMHYRDDRLYPNMDLYPMIYAREASDITKALAYYSQRKDQLVTIGNEARTWLMHNMVNRALDDIQKILNT